MRFSLRTLLLSVLLTTSILALHYKWSPWRLEQTINIDGYIHSANFSPDAKEIVVAGMHYSAPKGNRGYCAIWQLAQKTARVKMVGQSEYVYSAKFSPDRQHVVTASSESASMWDSTSGREAVRLNLNSEVLSVDYSPDGQLIATGSADGAHVWNLTGSQKLLLLSGVVFSVDFSKNGSHLVTAERANIARVWDIATGKVMTTLLGHSDSVRTAMFSPDGSRVVTASKDGTTRVWDTTSGKELLKISDHMATVNTTQFSPDGRCLITASEDDGARILNASSGEELWVSKFNTVGRSATYSPDGHRLVITGAGAAYVLVRQRPEYWWGFMTLVEFWLTLILMAAIFWSLKLHRKPRMPAETQVGK